MAKAGRAGLAQKAWSTAGDAAVKSRAFLRALRMAVPTSQWAENQVYLKSLLLLASSAAAAAKTATNNLRSADMAIKANPIREGLKLIPKRNILAGGATYGFKPASISIKQLNNK